MKEVTYKLNVETNSAVKEVDDLNKSLETTNDEVSGLKTSGKALGALKTGAKGVAGGFKMMGTALKAAGIGLALAAFATLKELFEQNQKVVDVFNIAFESLSLAFSDFFNFISKNVGAVSEFFKKIFDDPLASVKSLGNAIKDNIIERVKSALEVFGFLGKAMKKLFAGDFKGAIDEVKNAGSEFVDVLTGVDNSVEKASEVISEGVTALTEYTKSTVEAATANVELKKQAELAAVANQGLIEKYDLQAESLRQIRDDERLSIEERKKANDELLLVLDQQEKAMLSNAQISLRAAQAELKKDKNNIEFKKAVMEAENELAAVRAQVAGFRSEQQANDLALSKEELEMTNSKLEAENNLSIERKRFNAEQIEDNLARLEKQKEIDAEEKEIQTTRLQGIIDTANAGTQAKIDAEIALNEFLEQARQQELTREKEIGQAKLAATQKNNDEILASDEAVTAARVSLEQALVNATSSALTSIAQLAGEGTKIAKVAAIADIIIGTGVGFIQGLDIAQKSAKATGPGAAVAFPIFYATQVAAVLSAAAQAKNILSKAKGPSAPTISAPSGGGTGTSATQAPSFNVVGQSGFNQIAGALGQQPPAQAFVVAGDVTTAQQLQNNTIQQATF